MAMRTEHRKAQNRKKESKKVKTLPFAKAKYLWLQHRDRRKKDRRSDHIYTCAQLEKIPCPANKSLHNEGKDEHWWSGWPGAYCMKCGSEDKNEICIGNACVCHCHDEFWAEYEKSMTKETKG